MLTETWRPTMSEVTKLTSSSYCALFDCCADLKQALMRPRLDIRSAPIHMATLRGSPLRNEFEISRPFKPFSHHLEQSSCTIRAPLNVIVLHPLEDSIKPKRVVESGLILWPGSSFSFSFPVSDPGVDL